MFRKEQKTLQPYKHFARWVITAVLILTILAGCASSNILDTGPSTEDLAEIDYTPLQRDDWEVSTPEEQGVDPEHLWQSCITMLRNWIPCTAYW